MKIRSSLQILSLALIFGLALPDIVHAQRADVEPIPVCIYGSQSFSEGAQICMQRQQMLTCAARGDKAVWQAVTDRELNARCLAPFAFERATSPAPVRPGVAWRARPRSDFPPVPSVSRAEPAPSSGSNCFTFNNRRFCE